MRTLTVDIGNSRIKLSVFEGDDSLYSALYDSLSTTDAITIVEKFNVTHAIISSVTGYDYACVSAIEQKISGTILLDSSVKLPIKNGYGTPKTLGADRIAAVAGAHSLSPGTPLLVVDAGTAITYDFVTADGIYKGGNIAPGAALRFRSLNEHTSRLPLVELGSGSDDNFLGVNTHDAIWNGVVRGIAYEIEGYISDLKREHSNLRIFFTGGDAFFFEKYIKSSIFVVSNLTAIGLNAILNYNLS